MHWWGSKDDSSARSSLASSRIYAAHPIWNARYIMWETCLDNARSCKIRRWKNLTWASSPMLRHQVSSKGCRTLEEIRWQYVSFPYSLALSPSKKLSLSFCLNLLYEMIVYAFAITIILSNFSNVKILKHVYIRYYLPVHCTLSHSHHMPAAHQPAEELRWFCQQCKFHHSRRSLRFIKPSGAIYMFTCLVDSWLHEIVGQCIENLQWCFLPAAHAVSESMLWVKKKRDSPINQCSVGLDFVICT